MIKASELRIGNWVIDAVKQRAVAIQGIEETRNKAWVNYANGSGIYPIAFEAINPIPLTDSILEKAGFVKDGKDHLKIPDIGDTSVYFYRGDKDVFLLQLSNSENTMYLATLN